MKIDIELLERMVGFGASGEMVLAALKLQIERQAPRRVADKVRKRADRLRTSADIVRTEVETVRTPVDRTIEGDLRVAITKAFEDAKSPNPVDTARAGLWLTQGYEAAIVLAVIKDIVVKNPAISSLNYFDGAIQRAHQQKAPKREEVPTTDDLQVDWDKQIGQFSKGFPWSTKWYGPEPGHLGCRAPSAILEKHGYDPTAVPVHPPKIVSLRSM